MLILIDTNILFDHWQLKNVDFTFLFNFIKNSDSRLLISELVVQENENNRSKKLQAYKAAILSAVKNINIICEDLVDVDFSPLDKKYTFKEVLEAKLEENFIEYLDFSMISQRETVTRALAHRPPFKDSEKGYRDTLIWLSLLHYLKKNEVEGEVAFISSNSNDFYNSKKTDLKAELIEDVNSLNLKCNIQIFNSLFHFIDEKVLDDKLLEEDELYEIEDQIQESTIHVLNKWPIDQLRGSLLERIPQLGELLTIKSHEFEIIEGVEDPGILKAKRIKESKVYVGYSYNFRIVALRVTISLEEFKSNYDILNRLGNYEEIGEAEIEVEVYPRLFFKSSFEYDTRLKRISGLTVSEVKYKM